MKNKILFLCSCLISAVTCFSQHQTIVGTERGQIGTSLRISGVLSAPKTPRVNFQHTGTAMVSPNLDINTSIAVKQQSITKEDIYQYSKKEKNHDSTLIMTQYFDSLGNIVEKDEFDNDTKEVWRITNMEYLDGLLMKKETTSRSSMINYLEKNIETYDHDSAGNIITAKDYNYYNDTLSASVLVHKKEYDSGGQLKQSFGTVGKKRDSFYIYSDSFYVYQTYTYNDEGRLTEVKNFSPDGTWSYSSHHQYNSETNVESVYLFYSYGNASNYLSSELFYDAQKRLSEEKNYEHTKAYLDHNTQTYSYNLNGLVESQSFEDIYGNKYFCKHYYTSK